jgi:hypothetical protein
MEKKEKRRQKNLPREKDLGRVKRRAEVHR